MNTSIRRTLKTAAAASLTAGLLAAGATAASAHVTVDPSATAEGGFTKLTFSVPNESETAKTNRLEVKLPTDTPLTSVSVKPMDGWKAQVVTSTLPKPVEIAGATVTKAATSVIWTADAAHQIGQKEFQTFTLSVGRLPAAGTTLMLPAAQGYTDGTTVNWADAAEAEHDHASANSSAAASAPAAEKEHHPAPSFVVTAAEAADGSASATPASETQAAGSNGGQAAGWIGLVAGLLGLAAGATALVRTRAVKK
ncbi:YcnI family protein [Arthrobacter sp. FW305-BF8]|uniref:YcnI family copper-binding membrane protein n=1 Tax=Arthrobacter sp. FW305-BF8 TaxID=2879617 RepID=UPI001F334F4B|nr:YcnI family protein [Arthrobacter sp. FW305-BF8]UKA54748.1 YcnI family protein [Arthrobacter sp. FW305-BF8]